MGDFTSYSTYVPDPTGPTEPRPQVQINPEAGRTYTTTVRDGKFINSSSGVSQVSAAELNPHHNDGTVFATARGHEGSLGLSEITENCTIEVNGVRAPVKTFAAMGLVHKDANGDWQEGSGLADVAPEPEAKPEATEDDLSMPEDVASAVDRALDGVSDSQIEPLVATGLAVATGELDHGKLVAKMVSFSGVTEAEAATRIATMQHAYQLQADTAITSRCGISEADLPDFYAWAKANQTGALRAAIEKQVHQNNLGGYRALAERFLAENPPSVEAITAAGHRTRRTEDRSEVFLSGHWMTIATAARLGLL